MIWTVSDKWKDETVVILAGGPSLREFKDSALREARRQSKIRIITINDSWLLVPWADVQYFCDDQWWTNQIALNRRVPGTTISFHDMIYKGFWVRGGGGYSEHPQVHSLKFTGQQGLEESPTGLRHGSNSGYQAINLAYHFGASRIILLGYDMKCQGNRTHWHNEERPSAIAFEVTLSKQMLPNFETLVEPLTKAGVEVINATPGSAIECFTKMSLEEALALPKTIATAL